MSILPPLTLTLNLNTWTRLLVPLCLGALVMLPASSSAQGVSINSDDSSADASSILELKSTSQGMLTPRMTTTERDAIVLPATGLLIYNTTTGAFNFYQAGWQVIGGPVPDIILPINGGTGISNNNAATLQLSGSFATTITTTASTGVTLPISGTLYGTAANSITSAQLSNSLSDKTGTGICVYSASPAFTGIPVAPTAAVGTNTTQLATTAFVLNNMGGYCSVSTGSSFATTSPVDVLVTEMAHTPGEATYAVMFNGVYSMGASGNTTPQGASDLTTAYNTLNGVTATNTTHTPAFGSGETLNAGVYTIGAAGSVAGSLTLDALGDPNAVFIFRYGGAFSTGASSSIILANGASACNIFWVSEGAVSLGATSTMKGTLIANNGAILVASGCSIIGRLFSTTGAVTFDGSTVTIPNSCTYLDLGILSSFAAFTSIGAVSNSGSSSITGDVGTNGGAISGFGAATVNGTLYGPSTGISSGTFSIYQNGVLVANSSRTRTSSVNTADITLHSIVTVSAGQAIEVRCRTDSGTLTLGNRILTLTKVQ
jgi:hypothetical protein